MNTPSPPEWLLLIHVLPPKPDYLRVKIWRRLQGLGAIAVKNSVYVLPSNERTREDFQWLQKEIEGIGGESSLCEARFMDGLSDPQIRALFNVARDSDYAQLSEELRETLAATAAGADQGDELRIRARRLRKRFDQILALDFFDAGGRAVSEEMLKQLDEALSERRATRDSKGVAPEFLGRTWVTRPKLGVDRMASAWLIQRFIDRAAKFRFAPQKEAAKSGELRFDMAKADFTHEGDRCTFEVLLERFSLSDLGLAAIGRIVHDLDLKDGKYRDEETAGIAAVLAGIEALHADDDQRLRSASMLLDALHRALNAKSVDAR